MFRFVNQKVVQTVHYDLCINCKHFIMADAIKWPGANINNSIQGRCKLNGSVNLVTGEIEYDLAHTVRSVKNKNSPRCELFKCV